MTTQIRTIDGTIVLIDDSDLPLVSPYKWFLFGGDYIVTNRYENGKASLVYLHRMILGTPRDKHVHHKNGQRWDNRRCNLEELDPVEHRRRHPRLPAGERYGYLGVRPQQGKWRAVVQRDEGYQTMGSYDTIEEAARARDRYVVEHGIRTRLNFPVEAQ